MQLCSVPEPEYYKEMGGIICPLMRQCAFPSQNPTVKQLTRLGSCSFTNLPSALNYSESWLSIFLFAKHASNALGFPNNFSFFYLFPNFSCLSAMCLTSMPTPMPLSLGQLSCMGFPLRSLSDSFGQLQRFTARLSMAKVFF